MDVREWFNNIFKIILVDLKNTDDRWINIKVNKMETFKDQCSQKRRPRICWNLLKTQLQDENIKIMYEGKLEDIFN